MAARGKGVIVNTSTMVGQFAAPGMAVYGATKAGLNLRTPEVVGVMGDGLGKQAPDRATRLEQLLPLFARVRALLQFCVSLSITVLPRQTRCNACS
jgi:hypothetical protein